MADHSLRRDRASVTIPARYVGRLRRESMAALGAAADNIQEAAKWNHEGKAFKGETEPRTVSADELAVFDGARELFELVPPDNGAGPVDLELEAVRRTLVSAAEGCYLEVVDDFGKEAERVDGDTDPLIDEFRWWRGLRDRLKGAEATAA